MLCLLFMAHGCFCGWSIYATRTCTFLSNKIPLPAPAFRSLILPQEINNPCIESRSEGSPVQDKGRPLIG